MSEHMALDGTPFVALHREGFYMVGRSDTKELLCIGEFNKAFGNMYGKNETVYLLIRKDGTASQFFPFPEDGPTDVCAFYETTAIVAIKFDCYWIMPREFKEWARAVFPELVKKDVKIEGS